MSLLGVGWTLGNLKSFAETGQIAYLTYYETTGWFGVIDAEGGPRLPQWFNMSSNCVFPIYHLFADIGNMAGDEIILSESENPLQIEVLALRKGNLTRVLLANLSHEAQSVIMNNPGGNAKLWFLDETNTDEAMRTPATFRQTPGQPVDASNGLLQIVLRPYAMGRVDILSSGL